MKIQIAQIIPNSVVDGPGTRTVLFVQGCSLACPGCQSRALWPANGGRVERVKDVVETLAFLSQKSGNVTLSGGEIFQQPAALAELVAVLHAVGPRNVIAYSGYTWEQLFQVNHPARPWLAVILPYIDVLVDGRFIKAMDDDLITYRGSRNQRPIDVQATLAEGRVIQLDWDHPEIVIGESGELVLPEGLVREFGEMGEVQSHSMCGQVRR